MGAQGSGTSDTCRLQTTEDCITNLSLSGLILLVLVDQFLLAALRIRQVDLGRANLKPRKILKIIFLILIKLLQAQSTASVIPLIIAITFLDQTRLPRLYNLTQALLLQQTALPIRP